ncbi:hypothetical protein A1Q1_01259 [Trichosporon asahii var. asahii CBS 2479]|uniref:Las1-domain-containing protein n=1 Tax=Trichosporon asahii var. asahii (strain ATCC 90039 / CBS 2479 / JCM 2466 / KCTC 7840 / NBRC 103889/ NCYC 2677 / UAMH 7654) TaxID=1186058 RepID=J4UEG4_TRIAS|nr:hypothetical protein A1Q1_01259 [Trichosporon asahii var. asahii CBS 2479]EJT49630.1 hypothetical protein A1Q1_01259 [Trichosporon asahii var. asahii CBS 2479]
MRVPRRVPWASKAELAELYDLLFAPGANDASRQAALSRAASATRMSYAMAVVRFVNGMVDPLQTGPYARPISHLAASLGIPSSLVALRHRATHEDLPPLPMLRRAVEQALDYLHRQSFLPLLASSSAAGWDRRAKLEGLVTEWKKIVKARVRTHDVTNESESGLALRRLKRAIDAEDADDVLDAVVRTGLVPVARKKRSHRRANRPPKEGLAIWRPLLAHLDATAPVSAALTECLVGALLDTAPRLNPPPAAPDAAEDHRKEMASYRWTLGTWLLWLWAGEGGLTVPEEERTGVLRRIARELVHGDDVLRRVYAELAEDTDAPALDELDELLLHESEAESESDEEELEGLEIDDGAEKPDQAPRDVDAQLAAMEANLAALNEKTSADGSSVPGWEHVAEWKAAPIGVWV